MSNKRFLLYLILTMMSSISDAKSSWTIFQPFFVSKVDFSALDFSTGFPEELRAHVAEYDAEEMCGGDGDGGGKCNREGEKYHKNLSCVGLAGRLGSLDSSRQLYSTTLSTTLL